MLLADVPWFSWLLNLFILILGLVLIFLVLIQRGKGGGLVGAFGGPGGSSAFGTRAGNLFTRLTLILALAWLLLLTLHVKIVQQTKESPGESDLIGRTD